MAYSEGAPPTSESCVNVWRLISSAPHSAWATGTGGNTVDVGVTDVGCWDGAAEDADAEGGAEFTTLPDDVEPLCEVSATAMAALAPATTKTLAAARTGVQVRFQPERPLPGPRRKRGRRCPPRRTPSPRRPAWLASRNATSSTVTRRRGSGLTRRSISDSCHSSVFTTPHLRS